MYFRDYFSNTTKPAAKNLFLLLLAILTLDTFRSVRFAHKQVISRLTGTSLNAFYYTLRSEHYDHSSWLDTTASKAFAVVPDELCRQPCFLSIDDTMVEKKGKKFDLCSTLYDHAAHNGSSYLNGHCMVSLLLSFPVLQNGKIRYLSVPLGYRLWDKEKTKLQLAAELVRQAMGIIGSTRQVILLCDSWYPKAEVADLVNRFENLELVCNARTDTVLYDLPPAPTGKRGRPRKHGDRLELDQIPLKKIKGSNWRTGTRRVITRLWKDKIVYALVTAPKKGNGSRRLFLCTKNPEEIFFDAERCEDETIRTFAEEGRCWLPLAWYHLRWNIELSYYEGKTFWSLEKYRIRGRQGIERLVNLESVAYSAMTLLPYSDRTFAGCQSASAQETKYEISQQIQANIILCSFGKFLETVKNSSALIKIVENYILSGIAKIQKL